MAPMPGTTVRELPGLGNEDVFGFPADACPKQLPDLSRHHSTLAEVLREQPSLYATLRERQTHAGVGLARCIKVGIDNPGHPMVKTVGLVAGDEESYDVFHDLFNPVVERHQREGNPGGSVQHVPALPGYLGLATSRLDASGRYVVSTQVRAWRCLRGFRFPPAMSREERGEVERVLARALLQLPEKLAGEYLPLRGSQSYGPRPGGMDTREETALNAAGHLFEAPDSSVRLSSGAARHWPEGRGIYSSRGRDFCVWVNEQEHLRVAVSQKGDDLQGSFRLVGRALDVVARSIGGEQGFVFAHSDRLGFLTSNPANLGTAMQASVMVELPLLANFVAVNSGVPSWRTWCASQRVHVRNSQATDLFELTNADRLGTSEVYQVNLLFEVVSRSIQMEQRLEAGHPIDDLLSTAVQKQVSDSIQEAVLQAAAMQKARASMLYGLETGQLFDALQTARPNAANGLARPGSSYDPMEAAAEAVFDSILRYVVLDSQPENAAGEAEEVQSATPMREHLAVRPDSQGLFSGKQSRQDRPNSSGRPYSNGSIFTVNASSSLSMHAQDFVADLMHNEVAQVVEEDNLQADLAMLRIKASTALAEAASSGRLGQVLLDVAPSRGNVLKFGADKVPEAELGTLRVRAGNALLEVRDILMEACENGHLGQALLEVRLAETVSELLDVEKLRLKASALLLQACQDGSLDFALAEAGSGMQAAAASWRTKPSVGTWLQRRPFPQAPCRPPPKASPVAWAQKPSVGTWLARPWPVQQVTAPEASPDFRAVAFEKLSKLMMDGSFESALMGLRQQAQQPSAAELRADARAHLLRSLADNTLERTLRAELGKYTPAVLRAYGREHLLKSLADGTLEPTLRAELGKYTPAVLRAYGREHMLKSLKDGRLEPALRELRIQAPPTEKPKQDGPVNDERAHVFLGNNKLAHLGPDHDGTGRWYCGRTCDESAVPNGDGFCGPDGGPQCPSCKRYQASLAPPVPQEVDLNDLRDKVSKSLFNMLQTGELEKAMAEVASQRKPTTPPAAPPSAEVGAPCRDCGNTGKTFLGTLCSCPRGAALEKENQKGGVSCKECNNTGKTFLGTSCSCPFGAALEKEGAKAVALCRDCGGTGKTFLGEFCTCAAGVSAEKVAKKPQVASSCKNCDNTGKDFLGEFCSCPIGTAAQVQAGKCRDCSNTGRTFLGEFCTCALGMALQKDGQQAKVVCRNCGNTGKTFSGEPCKCPAAVQVLMGPPVPPLTFQAQALCRSCGNTGRTFLGQFCNCGVGEAAAKLQVTGPRPRGLPPQPPAPPSTLALQAGSNPPVPPTQSRSLVQARPPPYSNKSPPFGKPADNALALVWEVVCARDRRIGELTAMIRETEVRVIQQDQTCRQMEDMVTAAKHDLAHIELDIEWHRQALDGAESRSFELETGTRKLRLELDFQAQKVRHHDLDAGPSIQSSRTDISTATGNSMWSSAFSPITPRQLHGLTLDPIVSRR